MRIIRNPWVAGLTMVLAAALTTAGCMHLPNETNDYTQGPAPRRMPSPEAEAKGSGSYEDSLTGGQVFAMYCNYCHNAPSLAERNFANFRNVASHMRVRANLTGKEYDKLMEFLRRWNDQNPHTQPETSPKRFIFSQPINELRPQPQPNAGADQAQPKVDQPKDAPPKVDKLP